MSLLSPALDRFRPPTDADWPPEITDSDLEEAVRAQRDSLTAADVADELVGCSEVLEVALRTGDAAMVGRIVLAVREAAALRQAWYRLVGEARGPSATQAASLAVLGGSVRCVR